MQIHYHTHKYTKIHTERETFPRIPLIPEAVHKALFRDRYVMKY